MGTGPLAGVRVLDLAAFGPGSRASRWLADLGAEIVKISTPGAADSHLAFHAYGAARGFRQLSIDLKSDEGRAVFLELADRADVIIEGNRPGTAARLGIDYATLAARNPRLVYCSITGFGQQSPHSTWAGHDLGYLGFGGYLHNSGRGGDGLPAMPGATIADAAGGGMQAVMAVAAALYERERSGAGRFIDVSIVDGVLALMSLAVDEYLATGAPFGPQSSLLTGKFACYGIYSAGDDKPLVVAAIEAKFWANLCRLLDLSQFVDRQYDADSQDEIRAALQSRFATRERDVWVDELGPKDTCVAPAYAIDEVVGSAHVLGRELLAEARHARVGAFRQLGALVAAAPRVQSPVAVGAHATDLEDVLGEAGIPAHRIAALREAGLAC